MKRILSITGIIVLVILALFVSNSVYSAPEITKQQLRQKFQSLKTQYKQSKAERQDVTKTEALARQAKQSYDEGDYGKANELLDEAFTYLEKANLSIFITQEKEPQSKGAKELKQEARRRLSQVTVASHYERITDVAEISRSIDEVIKIFKETNTELIFRSFWRWRPVPESQSDTIPGIPASLIKKAAKVGYTYQQYQDVANEIKKEIPNAIFVGAISAQRINKLEVNPVTREILGQDKTWGMAFDPEKWNLGVSKETFQYKRTKSWHWINTKDLSGYEPKYASAYFPDITNEKYKDFLLCLAKKQIDSGANAIWIDMLYQQALFIQKHVKNTNHPAVKTSFEAASKIVDDIHNYGYSKGKYIYVGTWWNFITMPNIVPDVDFVTATPRPEEVAAKKINEAEWINMREKIKGRLGDIPVFVFIDHGNDGLPLAVFSQKLTSKEQNEFLRDADRFFADHEMVFVYPVHGGFMGKSAKKLAFGRLKIYDSLAPEFDTYETIKELTNKKDSKKKAGLPEPSNSAIPTPISSVKPMPTLTPYPEITKQELRQKFQTLKFQCDRTKVQGLDVSEAERLGKEAKQAFDSGDYKKTNELLDSISNILTNNKTPSTSVSPTPLSSNTPNASLSPSSIVSSEIKEKAKERLSQVKVISLYENITDGVLIGRSMQETIDILKETKTDLIFRGFWKWMPVVNSPDNIPFELLELVKDRDFTPKQVSNGLRKSGNYYQELKRWISAIKKEIPDIIFVGAIPAQTLARIEYNPVTGKVYSMEETWGMALDPQKWDITRNGKPVTKEQFQSWFYGIHPYGGKTEKYDWRKVPAFFPDITNPNFQELLLSWAKKHIDSGTDAIWTDMLYSHSMRLAQITRDVNHPSVKESVAAASKIVDEIHKYGKSKGKYIYTGSWDGPFVLAEVANLEFPYSPPDLDFVTVSPGNKEILDKKLNNARWEKEIPAIKKKYGDIPIFAFIDWAFDESQTVIFSQKLSKEEQRGVLKTFDGSFAKMGVNFVYPVHGGYLGRGQTTTKLAWDKYRIYDALAPEFQTYETISELARRKSDKGLSVSPIDKDKEEGNWIREGIIYRTHPVFTQIIRSRR